MPHRNKETPHGVVYWLTGMSASGKTTIARQLVAQLRAQSTNVVFLDGDELREAFGNDLGHTEADRRKSAMRNSRLCKLLSDQGVTVVCATISLFHDCQNWNRENISSYREIWISAPLNILQQRDPKKIYKNAKEGKAGAVVGLDIPAELPKKPDFTVDNDGRQKPKDIAASILEHFQAVRPKAA